MPGFRDIQGLETVYYGSGECILEEFLLPVLERAIGYDRITSYFSLNALLAISQGLDSLYRRGGRMRLAVGIHDFPKDAAKAVASQDDLQIRIEGIRQYLLSGITSLKDSLQKDRLATVALMIEDGFLEVKAVGTANEHSIFHSKLLIMQDDNGEAIAAMGSINETESGLGGNFENLMVLKSWINADGVGKQRAIFDRTWAGRESGIIVQDLTRELAQDIVDGLGRDYINKVRLRLTSQASILDATQMPSYFFVSGAIPALYQHQERAVLEGLSRWPVRVLYADEVGLGKTYEVAATISYLVRYCGAKRVVILTPKSVLTQWQEELCEKFHIDAWRYDSASRVYVSNEGRTSRVRNGCPVAKDMPSVALISAQFARGSSKHDDIFSMPDAVLPDVLAVDEAHAARVSIDIGGGRKTTRLYRVLRKVAPYIPHVILATATPMQKDAVEYHSLLNLLGLPNHWSREKAFELSLNIVASEELPTLSALSSAPTLLFDVVESMNPSLSMLSDEEVDLLAQLTETSDKQDRIRIVQSHWDIFRSLFIKIHPARLLTVRNTRRSLEDIGYIFPRRNLQSVTLTGHTDVVKFYDRINLYISSTYLGAERILFPDKKFSDGFVKSSYQQRMASSLYSCGRSLEKRKAKLIALKNLVAYSERSKWQIDSDLDVEDEDDAMLGDGEIDQEIASLPGKMTKEYRAALNDIDPSQVIRAIDAEIADIRPLISRLDVLRTKDGDPKVDSSIDTIVRYLKAGNQVLAFSRYTDTVDALLERWGQVDGGATCFGVYTGQRADFTRNGTTKKVTKDDIKDLLNTGEIKVMFCSDAASEGLNLQAARVLVNVDVPWTPARLEQRIGRVARLGQKAESVEIVNVWYPRSVEERMYTRIEQRLKGYNLAVGEFPEVVADSIRRSILDGDTDDDSMQHLQDIRNSLQTEALTALWYRGDAGLTVSQSFRKRLLEEVAIRANYTNGGTETTVVHLRNGSAEAVTTEEGNKETISLSSKCVIEYCPVLSGYRTVKDGDGRYCAYAYGKSVLNPELLPDALGSTTNFMSLETVSKPRWLPDVRALSLGYAIEYEPVMPSYWPPQTGDGV